MPTVTFSNLKRKAQHRYVVEKYKLGNEVRVQVYKGEYQKLLEGEQLHKTRFETWEVYATSEQEALEKAEQMSNAKQSSVS